MKYRLRTLLHGKLQSVTEVLAPVKAKAVQMLDAATLAGVKLSQGLFQIAGGLADAAAMALSSATLSLIGAVMWAGGGILLLGWVVLRSVDESVRTTRTALREIDVTHNLVRGPDGRIDWERTRAAARRAPETTSHHRPPEA